MILLTFIVPRNTDSYLYAYNNKCKLLENTPSPRIIFVGGSNLAFGLDSERIKDSLNINVVNVGLHAGIGLKYMIDDIILYVRKGDTVVFAPEYNHFYCNMAGEPEVISEIMSVTGFKKARLLNIPQWLNVIKGIPTYLGTQLCSQKGNSSVYKASNFNEYGDEVRHWQLPCIPIAKPTKWKNGFNTTMSRYFIDRLKELQTRCKIIVIPPAYMQISYDFHKKEILEVASFLEQEGFSFAISPQECAFPDDYAYDTDYHMNKKGVDNRTAILIKSLRAQR